MRAPSQIYSSSSSRFLTVSLARQSLRRLRRGMQASQPLSYKVVCFLIMSTWAPMLSTQTSGSWLFTYCLTQTWWRAQCRSDRFILSTTQILVHAKVIAGATLTRPKPPTLAILAFMQAQQIIGSLERQIQIFMISLGCMPSSSW